MKKQYDKNDFIIYMITMINMYILFASIFIFKRIRRWFSKEPVVGISHICYGIDSSEEEGSCRN